MEKMNRSMPLLAAFVVLGFCAGMVQAADFTPANGLPRFDAAICTVSSTVAQSLSFAPQGGYRDYRLTVVPRSNADGSVTFIARFTHKGASISFR